jgi:hypothetical protein
MKRVLACFLLALYGCTPPSAPVTTPPTLLTYVTPSATATPTPECLVVSAGYLADLGIPSAVATTSDVEPQPGVTRKGRVWFVATKDGATWVTNIDVTGADDSGLTLPLNDKARAASEVGRDTEPGAPVYGGIDDTHAGAVQSRACAASSTE